MKTKATALFLCFLTFIVFRLEANEKRISQREAAIFYLKQMRKVDKILTQYQPEATSLVKFLYKIKKSTEYLDILSDHENFEDKRVIQEKILLNCQETITEAGIFLKNLKKFASKATDLYKTVTPKSAETEIIHEQVLDAYESCYLATIKAMKLYDNKKALHTESLKKLKQKIERGEYDTYDTSNLLEIFKDLCSLLLKTLDYFENKIVDCRGNKVEIDVALANLKVKYNIMEKELK